MDRPSRRNNAAPSESSSPRTAWLTALGVRLRSDAAARKEPVRAADSKARRAERGRGGGMAEA